GPECPALAPTRCVRRLLVCRRRRDSSMPRGGARIVAVDEGRVMSPDRGGRPVDIVLLSTADWDNPFWTNKQHVAQELARRGHRVLYIDSLGLRRPSATGRDLRRVLRRLFPALRRPRAVRDRLWVWSPVVIPLQRFGAVRWINKAL